MESEYYQLKGTHRDHWIQTPVPHRTTQKSDHIIRMHCPDASWIPAAQCHDHCPGEPAPVLLTLSFRNLFPIWPSPDAAPCHSLGSCHCYKRAENSTASPLPSWGARGNHGAFPKPRLLWAEQNKGFQPPLIHLALQNLHYICSPSSDAM